MMSWKKKVILALSAAAIGSVLFTGCGGSSNSASSGSGDKIVLRYAENQAPDYPTTQAAHKFADIVKEKTNGRIEVEVYDSGQLGDEKSVIEQIQFGGIDMSRVALTPLSEFNKQLMALQLPYLYRDSDHMWKVLDGDIGDELLKSTESSGIVGLSWYDAGARNFYNSKKEIKSLDDLKGFIEWIKQRFLQNGGIKEQMYRARTQYRGYGAHGAPSTPSNPSPPSSPSSASSPQPPKPRR